MANANNDLANLMSQLDGFLSTKTVVGEPIHIDGTILVPLVDVQFGAASAAKASNNFIERSKDKEKKVNGDQGAGAGGIGAKINPSAMLVIQNGTTQLINVGVQDGANKILDMIPSLISKAPDIVSKFTSALGGHTEDTIAKEAAEEEIDEDVKEAIMKDNVELSKDNSGLDTSSYHKLD